MSDKQRPQLTPRLLDRNSIDKAYPLVRGILPDVTLERWAEFAKPYFAARSPKWPRGLMTIQNGESYILGLFGFEVRDELRSSRTLFIYNIIVPQILGHDLIWAVVVSTAETLAAINDCRTIQIKLSDDLNGQETGREWLGPSLTTSGYIIEGIHAFKQMGPDALAHG